MQPLLSFVIPMYNSGKTISKCINSILKINTIDIEVVVVDDGSTDNSLYVCQKEFGDNPKIKIYTQKNAGVSIARNQGILMAQGKFLMFVDSDDYIDEKELMHCIKNLTSEDRMIFFGYAKVFEDKTLLFRMEKGLYKTKELSNEVREKLFQSCILHNIGTKIYPRKLIVDNSIHFENSIAVYEDVIFALKAMSKAKEIYICNEIVYYYLISRISLTHSYRKNFFEAVKLLDGELTNCGYDKQFVAWVYTNRCIRTIMNEMLANSSESQKEIIKCISEDSRLKECIQENVKFGIKLHYKIVLMLMRYQLQGAVFLYCKCLSWIERHGEN